MAKRCAHIGLDGEAVPKYILFVVTLSILLLKSFFLFHKTLCHTMHPSSYRWRILDPNSSSYSEKDVHMSVSTEKPARNLFIVMYIRQKSFFIHAFCSKKLSAKPRVDPAIGGTFLTRRSRLMDRRQYVHRFLTENHVSWVCWACVLSPLTVKNPIPYHKNMPFSTVIRMHRRFSPQHVGWSRYS